jgi:ABC-type Fe3+/spermidine/putrescine transport system ATPase subunit
MPDPIHQRPQALALRGIGKSYGKVRVIDDVSFELAKGEIAALLGPSGCGKTTTLRSIAGFVDPDAGTVMIEGHTFSGLRTVSPSDGRGQCWIRVEAPQIRRQAAS